LIQQPEDRRSPPRAVVNHPWGQRRATRSDHGVRTCSQVHPQSFAEASHRGRLFSAPPDGLRIDQPRKEGNMAERENYPADKQAAIAELTDRFSSASAAVLTEYRGLTVEELQQLRRTLGEGARYRVAKNTLAKRAADAAGV